MISENEVVTLLLGIGVLVFIGINRMEFRRLPESKTLIAAVGMFMASWMFTVLEGFSWEGFLNFLEHVSYAGGSILVAIWCWKLFGRKEALK